jgi:tetratricopeptide (TPR) repeat protein
MPHAIRFPPIGPDRVQSNRPHALRTAPSRRALTWSFLAILASNSIALAAPQSADLESAAAPISSPSADTTPLQTTPSLDAHSPPANPSPTYPSLQLEIAHWIEQLGAESYSERLQAKSELERIGVRALDQLHLASFHPDPQIASQARFLVQSNQFSWAWDSDPFSVRRILDQYTTADLHEKTSYIDQLIQLENNEGLSPLCRLVRYETQGCLGKRAALLLMRGKPSFGQSIEERNALITGLVDGARSTAGQWVSLALSPHSHPTTGTFPTANWEHMIQTEKQLLLNHSMDTSVEILTDLRKWVAERLSQSPTTPDQALILGRSITQPIAPSLAARPQNQLEFAQWALSIQLPELVQEQHALLDPNTSLQDARYGYLLAECLDQQNQLEQAQTAAKLTSQRIAIDSTGQPAPPPSQKAANPLLESMVFRSSSQAFERSSVAEYLINRGRFAWAEQELRIALQDQEDSPEFSTILNLTQLSQLLHEVDREQEAAQVLQKFTERFEREPMFKTQVSEQSGDSLPSNHYLYLANHLAKSDAPEQARDLYLKSILLSTENVDALIGLFRLKENDEQKEQRKKLQQSVILQLRNEIDAIERELSQVNPRFLATEHRRLANSLNTLAWLIANTEGNKDEALQLSRKACALLPNRAAYLDTLAHCYAALGRFREAAQQQRRAVELEPFQPSLTKALIEFEAKANAQTTPAS